MAAFTLTRSEEPFVEELDFDDPIAFSESDDAIDTDVGDPVATELVGDGEEPREVVVFTPPAEPRDPFAQLTGGVSESLTIDDVDPLADDDLGLDETLD